MDKAAPRRPSRPVRRLSELEFQRVLTFVDRNLAKDIPIASLSSNMRMSASHFSHCFKETVGVSPYAFIARRKVPAAARLLTETDFSLEEIAEKVGFSNLGHFRRQFRKALGCNPSDVRGGTAANSTDALAKLTGNANN